MRNDGPATQISRDARIPLIDIGTVGLIKRGTIGFNVTDTGTLREIGIEACNIVRWIVAQPVH